MATYCTADIYKSGKGDNAKAGDLVRYDEEQTRTKAEGQSKWFKEGIPEDHEGQRVIVVRNKLAGTENEAGSVKASVEARVGERKGGRKVRRDAVTHLVARATMPDYSARSPEEREEFARLAMKFMADRYGGEENIVDCRWHFDQSSPHLHFTIVPITKDGRLSAKDLFKPSKKSMRQWQKDWFLEVAKPLGYDAPDFGKSQEKGYTKECVASRRQRDRATRQARAAANVAERQKARAVSAAEEARGQEARRDEAARAAEEAERRKATAEAATAALTAERARLDAASAAAKERAQAAAEAARAAEARAIVATSRASEAEKRLERLRRTAHMVAKRVVRAKAEALRGLRALARRCWGGASQPPTISNAARIAANSNKPQLKRGINGYKAYRADGARPEVRHGGR